jgi:hypothetical protein
MHSPRSGAFDRLSAICRLVKRGAAHSLTSLRKNTFSCQGAEPSTKPSAVLINLRLAGERDR